MLTVKGYKGIAGYTAKYKGASIITSIKDNLSYDSTVDVYSMLPLYAIPILSTK